MSKPLMYTGLSPVNPQQGSIWFDGKLSHVFMDGKWEIIEGQKWCDPDTNIVYTWLKDRWVKNEQ